MSSMEWLAGWFNMYSYIHEYIHYSCRRYNCVWLVQIYIYISYIYIYNLYACENLQGMVVEVRYTFYNVTHPDRLFVNKWSTQHSTMELCMFLLRWNYKEQVVISPDRCSHDVHLRFSLHLSLHILVWNESYTFQVVRVLALLRQWGMALSPPVGSRNCGKIEPKRYIACGT